MYSMTPFPNSTISFFVDNVLVACRQHVELMDLKIVSCGNRTSLFSRSFPSGKPQRILSVIQCSPVCPKLLCVHATRCHAKELVETREEKNSHRTNERKGHFVVSHPFLFRMFRQQNRDLPMTAQTIQFDFTFHGCGIPFVVEQVALIYCLYMCRSLFVYIFGSRLCLTHREHPIFVVTFGFIERPAHCKENCKFSFITAVVTTLEAHLF